jgi:hypothetical protein
MIVNQTEYRATMEAAEQLERALAADDAELAGLERGMRALIRESVEGQLQELRSQLLDYEQRYGTAPLTVLQRASSAVRQHIPTLWRSMDPVVAPAPVWMQRNVGMAWTSTSHSSVTTPMLTAK